MTDGMAGRVCVVTGASTGIGRETALELAGLGAAVLITCWDRGRGEAALAEIKQRSGNPEVELLTADFAVQAEVRRLAAAVLERCPRLDVLINNAGILAQRPSRTLDGFETMLAVNHLAPFLLTNLLLDRLRTSGDARVVNVSSLAHLVGHISRAALEGRKPWPAGFLGYATTKLANILFTRELARRVNSAEVTANALHPGTVRSTSLFTRALPRRLQTPTSALLGTALRPFWKSVQQGARTSVYLASSPEVEGVTGGYFSDCRLAWSTPAARDLALAQRLWLASARMTGVAATD